MVSGGSAASTMSIRITVLYLVVAGLSIYAWKDWFKSLCGLILIMAIIHHEDMPTNMFDIQGFNVLNIMFLSIFLAWAFNRQREGLVAAAGLAAERRTPPAATRRLHPSRPTGG